MEGSDAEARRLAKVINHPVRTKILELLGERGPLGWKELSLELGIGTGALYHHLDTLEGLVQRDPSKRYSLTKSGQIVFARTSKSHTIDAVQEAVLDIRREGSARRVAVSVFAPRSLLGVLTSTKASAALVFLGLSTALAAFSGVAGISPTLYYLRPHSGLFPTVGGFAASLGIVAALGYGASKFVLKSDADPITLAATTPFSFLPVFFVSALTVFPATASLFASSNIIYTLLLVFFQTWSSTILGAGLSVASGVRIERTLLFSLVVLYATMVLMLLQPRTL